MPILQLHLKTVPTILAVTGIYAVTYVIIIYCTGWLANDEKQLLARIFRTSKGNA